MERKPSGETANVTKAQNDAIENSLLRCLHRIGETTIIGWF